MRCVEKGILNFFPEVAALEVIVDDAHGLHEGVSGGGADEFPAAFFEIFGESNGFGGGGVFQGIVEGVAGGAVGGVRAKFCEVGMEGAKFCAEFEGAGGVMDNGFDFSTVAHDSGIGEKAGAVEGVESGYFFEVEAGEGLAEVFAFTEDGDPGEAALECFEGEFFVEAEVIGHRAAPFLVVVFEVEGVLAGPPAAGELVFAEDEPGGFGMVNSE